VNIGPHVLPNRLILAPMAGVTDRPFRQLCKRLGAGMAVSEMVASDSRLWATEKSILRGNHVGETEPIVVQIAGAVPAMMADASRYNVDRGAQIIDINMGCPAKKVCRVEAGSALMKDAPLVRAILEAVVAAARVPVTLKIRTGWDRQHKNAVAIARLAEDCGIAALAVHGRTRADLFNGEAEYETVAAVKRAVRIPVVANGDIDSPQKAKAVLEATGCDAIMIGRAAQGRPWIFRQIIHYLATGALLPAPPLAEMHAIARRHIAELHAFYGAGKGLKVARKHAGWYLAALPGGAAFCQELYCIDDAQQQLDALDAFFARLMNADSRTARGELAGVRRAA
jgi:tRNA-dihydrouridine synthase B